jgi:solute carrier family 35, member E1
MARWLALVPVIGGVILASVNEVDFTWMSLVSAAIANTFASVKGHENKKLMQTSGGIKQRLGSVGNQFAVTSIIAFIVTVPFAIVMEGSRFKEFLGLLKTSSVLRNNLLLSGLYFYGYNELATMTLKKTNAVTNSVANTAKRVIVILGVAAVMGESLDTMKLVGCSIAIGGVFLYSLISPGH